MKRTLRLYYTAYKIYTKILLFLYVDDSCKIHTIDTWFVNNVNLCDRTTII